MTDDECRDSVESDIKKTNHFLQVSAIDDVILHFIMMNIRWVYWSIFLASRILTLKSLFVPLQRISTMPCNCLALFCAFIISEHSKQMYNKVNKAIQKRKKK